MQEPSRRGRALADDFMALASELLASAKSAAGVDARNRRAISTAYYAVFHELCQLCADSLVGSGGVIHHEAIYRTVDHRSARKILTGDSARQISFLMEQIGGNFADLQNGRHAADYRPASADPISYERAEALIAMAQQTLFAIDLLGDDQRLAVAVLLISRPRSN